MPARTVVCSLRSDPQDLKHLIGPLWLHAPVKAHISKAPSDAARASTGARRDPSSRCRVLPGATQRLQHRCVVRRQPVPRPSYRLCSIQRSDHSLNSACASTGGDCRRRSRWGIPNPSGLRGLPPAPSPPASLPPNCQLEERRRYGRAESLRPFRNQSAEHPVGDGRRRENLLRVLFARTPGELRRGPARGMDADSERPDCPTTTVFVTHSFLSLCVSFCPRMGGRPARGRDREVRTLLPAGRLR